ncbi:MAG: hypothetical protein V4751_07390 [Pseudomonadota bacterium]
MFETLGNVGEFVGAVGVVASLLYLASQVRHASKVSTATTLQEIERDMREVFSPPQGLLECSFRPVEELTPVERRMKTQFFNRVVRAYENQWYHFTKGLLDEELFRGYQQHLRVTFSEIGFETFWEKRKKLGFFHPGFVTDVDEFLRLNPPLRQDDTSL